jgi:hypothetical protein
MYGRASGRVGMRRSSEDRPVLPQIAAQVAKVSALRIFQAVLAVDDAHFATFLATRRGARGFARASTTSNVILEACAFRSIGEQS